jgi:hypothetical protein
MAKGKNAVKGMDPLDFSIDVDCYVTGVIGHTNSTSVQMGPRNIGGHTDSQECGQESTLDIEVTTDTNVRALHFNGAWPIRVDDRITASVIAAKRIRIYGAKKNSLYDSGMRFAYESREFCETEHPYAIGVKVNGKCVAQYKNDLNDILPIITER